MLRRSSPQNDSVPARDRLDVVLELAMLAGLAVVGCVTIAGALAGVVGPLGAR